MTVVCPPNTGSVAIPLDGVIADCVTSPAWYDSESEKLDPAVVTVLFVFTKSGTPSLKLPRFKPPMAFVTTLSPVPVEVVILFPLIEYELGAAFVIT